MCNLSDLLQKGSETEYLRNCNGNSDAASSSLDQMPTASPGVVQLNPSKRLKLES